MPFFVLLGEGSAKPGSTPMCGVRSLHSLFPGVVLQDALVTCEA